MQHSAHPQHELALVAAEEGCVASEDVCAACGQDCDAATVAAGDVSPRYRCLDCVSGCASTPHHCAEHTTPRDSATSAQPFALCVGCALATEDSQARTVMAAALLARDDAETLEEAVPLLPETKRHSSAALDAGAMRIWLSHQIQFAGNADAIHEQSLELVAQLARVLSRRRVSVRLEVRCAA